MATDHGQPPPGDALTSRPCPPLRAEDHVRGEGEPVVVYADLACPRCAVTLLRLRDEGRAVALRHFALRARHPRAVPLARAAEAAALQGAFWPFVDALLEDQGRLDDPHLWQRCERLGLDVDRFEADRRSEAVAERVRRDTRDGLRAGVTTTPALLVPPLD